MTVYLVGAGPGDPGLITAKGLDLVRTCDALVYDVLVAPELVAEAPEDALQISREKVRQSDLNDLLVELGQRGLEVVRLKGGDPFIFGRGGEEALALAEAEVPFEVVPGVSALSAVPASAGIPITHRGVSAQVTLVSGHSAKGDELDYEHLARTPGTLVVFMGVSHLPEIAERLIDSGKDGRTPAAVISRGTHDDSESVRGELHEIAGRAANLESPALLVIGDVVKVGALLASSAQLSAKCPSREHEPVPALAFCLIQGRIGPADQLRDRLFAVPAGDPDREGALARRRRLQASGNRLGRGRCGLRQDQAELVASWLGRASPPGRRDIRPRRSDAPGAGRHRRDAQACRCSA